MPDLTIEKKSHIVNITCQGGLVELHVRNLGVTGKPVYGGGLRGIVKEFSRASRRNMLKLMASLERPKSGEIWVFLTLTYGEVYPAHREAKRHLDVFLKRLDRIAPGASGVWRYDLQERGAGHFHLLLFGLPFIPKSRVQQMWAEVIGDYAQYCIDPRTGEAGRPFTRIEAISHFKKAMSYVSKYAAAPASHSGFNYDAYLTVDGNLIDPVTGENMGTPGRWWGVWHRSLLPMAVEKAASVSDVLAAFYDFRRSVRAYRQATLRMRIKEKERLGFETKGLKRSLKRVGHWATGRDCGFFAFVEDADQWFEHFMDCVMAAD